MIKTSVKFQKDWSKTVGEVALTRLQLQTRNHASRLAHYGKPNIISPLFSSKIRGTINSDKTGLDPTLLAVLNLRLFEIMDL